MDIRITLSANAGVSVELGDYRILIDALHDSSIPGFSSLSPQMTEQLWSNTSFAYPDAVIFTHCHPDHYSELLANEACKHWSDARFYLPENKLGRQTLVSGDVFTDKIGELCITFFSLTHEKEIYRNVPHYGIMLSLKERNILIPGDCSPSSPELRSMLDMLPKRDVALLNFPWITLPRCRNFLDEYIKPKHIALFHLPFEEDDLNGYIYGTKQAVNHLPDKKIFLLDKFLKTVSF